MKTETEEEMHWLPDILTYPFRGSGKYILFWLVILSVVVDLVSFAPLIGVIAGIFLFAYFCAIYMNLIDSSADGEVEAPMFPDISHPVEDVMVPLMRLLGCLLVSSLPAMAYVFFAAQLGFDPWILGALTVFGAVYFPMALLAVTILDRMGGMSPHIVLPAIIRAMPHYLIACFIMGGMLGCQYGISYFLQKSETVPWLATYALLALVGAYTLMANARALGIVYREREDEIGWF